MLLLPLPQAPASLQLTQLKITQTAPFVTQEQKLYVIEGPWQYRIEGPEINSRQYKQLTTRETVFLSYLLEVPPEVARPLEESPQPQLLGFPGR